MSGLGSLDRMVFPPDTLAERVWVALDVINQLTDGLNGAWTSWSVVRARLRKLGLQREDLTILSLERQGLVVMTWIKRWPGDPVLSPERPVKYPIKFDDQVLALTHDGALLHLEHLAYYRRAA